MEQSVTVLDFYADWCAPCKVLTPILDDVKKDMPEVHIQKINVDEESDKAYEFGVSSIPTLVIIKDGVEVNRKIGLISKEELVKLL